MISSQIEYYNVVQCGVVLEIHENNKKVTHFVMRFFDMDQVLLFSGGKYKKKKTVFEN